MGRRPRRNHTPAFKAKAAVAAIKGEKTLIELAQEFDSHTNQIKQWRDQQAFAFASTKVGSRVPIPLRRACRLRTKRPSYR
jgi:transposase-like protein